MESVLNEVLQSEMTDHLGAAPEECASGRSGYRNGSYERELTTRVGTLCAGIPAMEVPRDRNGTVSTELFGRYQRSEKALVLSLMQMEWRSYIASARREHPPREHPPREKDHRAALRATLLEVYRLGAGRAARGASRGVEQVEAWAERSLGECPFFICDALQLGDDTSPWVPRQGAVRSTTVLLAVGVTDEGQHR